MNTIQIKYGPAVGNSDPKPPVQSDDYPNGLAPRELGLCITDGVVYINADFIKVAADAQFSSTAIYATYSNGTFTRDDDVTAENWSSKKSNLYIQTSVVPVGCVLDNLEFQSDNSDVRLILTGRGLGSGLYDNIGAANTTNAGVLTATTQTIGGIKTFTNHMQINEYLEVGCVTQPSSLRNLPSMINNGDIHGVRFMADGHIYSVGDQNAFIMERVTSGIEYKAGWYMRSNGNITLGIVPSVY